jgi:hypothetical protein
VRARDEYRLIVRRGGLAPAVLADPGRIDHIELVAVASGEVVLFWDAAPREASRLARALRADLASLDVAAFRRRWSTVEQ